MVTSDAVVAAGCLERRICSCYESDGGNGDGGDDGSVAGHLTACHLDWPD